MRKTALLSVISLLLFSSCAKDRYVIVSGYAQGGTYTVKYNGEDTAEKPEVIARGIDSLLTLIDNSLSGYNRSSTVSRINAGEKPELNDMIRDIYGVSYAIWLETGGAVDVAAGPLFDAWGFGFTSDDMPSREKIDSLMSECGMGRLTSDLESSLPLGPKLNFNAIAQGYSCDVIASYLKAAGVKDMLVDIGEIYCQGVNPKGMAWSIGVDRPTDGNNTPGAELSGIWKSDGGSHGVVTSGNYRKFYIRDGKKYAHTIDPRTGSPVSHNLLSATIIAENATRADALATYCMVIGLDEAREFVENTEGVEAFLVYDEDGDLRNWQSEGFSR